METETWDNICTEPGKVYHREANLEQTMEVCCLVVEIIWGHQFYFDAFNGNFYL